MAPRLVIALGTTLLGMLSANAKAGPNYIHGYISNVTFEGDEVMIIIGAGLPDNGCEAMPRPLL